MSELITIYWRDIPSQVLAKAGRRTARVMLPDRFQQAIDRAAMRAGRGSSDAYMADWRRVRQRCSADLQSEADSCAARLNETLDDERLAALVRVKGIEAHLGLSREEIRALEQESTVTAAAQSSIEPASPRPAESVEPDPSDTEPADGLEEIPPVSASGPTDHRR